MHYSIFLKIVQHNYCPTKNAYTCKISEISNITESQNSWSGICEIHLLQQPYAKQVQLEWVA